MHLAIIDKKLMVLVYFYTVTAKHKKIFLYEVTFYNFVSVSLNQIENYVIYITGNL